MNRVLCKIPKAGLGNQLFPIMKSYVFGRLNQLPVIVTGYNRLKIGPYLRNEKSKRKYAGSFRFQKNLIGEWIDKRKLKEYTAEQQIEEPPLVRIKDQSPERHLFIFTQIPGYRDLFEGLRDYRPLIKEMLRQIVDPAVFVRLEKLNPPCIGIHVRMGDFRKLEAGEQFSQVGQVRTPEEYFIDVINSIRKINGAALPVAVFSNGYAHELPALFALGNIEMIEGNADMVDLLLLSRSQIIVTSAGSTFSYWSGFLSNVPLIMHPDHQYQPIRLAAEQQHFYEGPMDVNNELLVRTIRAIRS